MRIIILFLVLGLLIAGCEPNKDAIVSPPDDTFVQPSVPEEPSLPPAPALDTDQQVFDEIDEALAALP